tara:strand:- start:491 stop:721 length:231 start_codon:yes stop_codon:yes gene_type:complete
MVAKHFIPPRDVLHRISEIFPDRTGAIGTGQPTAPHVFKNTGIPISNNQSIENDGVAMKEQGVTVGHYVVFLLQYK